MATTKISNIKNGAKIKIVFADGRDVSIAYTAVRESITGSFDLDRKTFSAVSKAMHAYRTANMDVAPATLLGDIAIAATNIADLAQLSSALDEMAAA